MYYVKRMKVAFNTDLWPQNKGVPGGPLIFSKRLKKALNEFNGITIVHPWEQYDIILVVISMEPHLIRKGAKVVQRLNGIYHNLSQDNEALNRPIREFFYRTDGIVYQSQFSRKLVRTFFGEPKSGAKETVIYNGADPKIFSKQGERIELPTEFNIITSSVWRPHKRLNDLINGFLCLSQDNKDVGLVVLGKVENEIPHPNIYYFSDVNPSDLPKFYRSCDILAHLTWIDNCPNSVVEAIVAGLPVICTNNGGTKELVRDSGVILESEPEWDFKLCWLYQPPKVEPELIADAIKEILSNKTAYIYERQDLNIHECAKQYVHFFKEVLNS